jgi:putative tricarboxylic transport membrane protein
MDVLANVASGFAVLLSPQNVGLTLLGVALGTLVGVLPGLGPVGAMAILLPLTLKVPPVSAVILLAGIYYGAQYGASTTAILVRIPGEASSIITCLDGYEMARQGRAGAALGISAFASFIAGTLSVVALMLFATPLASHALRLGPPEFFAIMVLGMSIVVILARTSVTNGVLMALVGFLLSTVGQDPITGVARFAFGSDVLVDGLGIAPVAMGLFGVGEILSTMERPERHARYDERLSGLLPTRADWRASAGPILRGSGLGFVLGVLPGGGPMISTFASYAVEKKLSKDPSRFGGGAIEGVSGPEAANNAAATGAFVPLFALGIPPNAIMAMLLGALMVHGVQPGPLLMSQHPQIFWGTVASMYVGNAALLALNLPLIRVWVSILRIPFRVLFPLVLLSCVIGAYAVNNSVGDVLVMAVFGIVGYVLPRLGYEAAPLILAFILGPLLEQAFHQSLVLGQGSPVIFFTRALTIVPLIAAAALVFGTTLVPAIRRRRRIVAAAVED